MNVWRPGHLHVLITSFVIGLFASVLIGLQQALAKAEASVKNSLSAVVFLQDAVPDRALAALADTFKAQDPEIVSITFTSKDQALQEAMKDPHLAKSLMLLKANPLPASFQLRYSDRAWWERFEPAETLRGQSAIQEIRWDAQAHSVFRSLRGWRLWTLRFSAFMGLILGVWAFIGLYRFLSLHGKAPELLMGLGLGWAGGALAWGLWSMGLRSIKADLSVLQPFWVWLLPMAAGAVAALCCFGLEVRRAD